MWLRFEIYFNDLYLSMELQLRDVNFVIPIVVYFLVLSFLTKIYVL